MVTSQEILYFVTGHHSLSSVYMTLKSANVNVCWHPPECARDLMVPSKNISKLLLVITARPESFCAADTVHSHLPHKPGLCTGINIVHMLVYYISLTICNIMLL